MARIYELHEVEYQRMAREGVRSWMERTSSPALDPAHVRFFEDVMAQPWFAKSGRVLELGCGTAPILQWFARRGYHGMGVDVSKTAVRMARRSNTKRGNEFRHADICQLDPKDFPRFDIVVDGQCLHCLTEDTDRARMLSNARRLLTPEGVFIVLTMCSPVDRQAFRQQFPNQRACDHRIYVPYEGADEYSESRQFGGATYVATRRIPHWKYLLREIRDADFEVQLHRFAHCGEREVCSALALCATIRA